MRGCHLAVVLLASTVFSCDALTSITSSDNTQSAAQRGTANAVSICHVAARGEAEITIEVGDDAVAAHLRHGDSLGPCFPDSQPPTDDDEGGDSDPTHPDEDDSSPPTTDRGLSCAVDATILTCTATGLEPSAYVALNVDLQDCNGGNYGIDGIADGYVGSDGGVSFVVDLAHMIFFFGAPLPDACSGFHSIMVAYQDGIAVLSTQIDLPSMTTDATPSSDDGREDHTLPPNTERGLLCTLDATILTCTATGLEPSAYVALNVDLQDCNGGNYGIDGIADGYVGSDGGVSFVVDLAHMIFFFGAPLPDACSGFHSIMVAYQDGIAVLSTQIDLPSI